jgi:hypothetical protein
MPDISMCDNSRCTRRLTCYRFTAKPNPYRQSYSHFMPDIYGECDAYWDNMEQVFNALDLTKRMGRDRTGDYDGE